MLCNLSNSARVLRFMFNVGVAEAHQAAAAKEVRAAFVPIGFGAESYSMHHPAPTNMSIKQQTPTKRM